MKYCWIFDVDGTLSNSDHRKHFLDGKWRDWDGWKREMGNDGPHQDVLLFVDICKFSLQYDVVICTGREEQFRELTENWLEKCGVVPDMLLMRKTGDYRDDTVVKREMLDTIRENGYIPLLVFEDRDRVVKMWRENNIRCFQVAEGNF